MRIYLFFLFVGLSSLTAQNPEYRLNDTLYVWEMHGLEMIADPANPDEVENRFYYGAPARVVDIDIHRHPAAMEVNQGYTLLGHWVRVIINRDTGYVFDGFLGRFAPFDLRSNAQGIDLLHDNYPGTAQVSKDIRSFSSPEGMNNGESREMNFRNGVRWELKKVKPCLVEKYTLETDRYAEAYLFMMAVYSNYFDQEANFMSEPEFLRMNGSKTEFILRGKGENQQISVYKTGDAYVINAFQCES